MPLYEYECEACSRRFEVIQKFSDPRVETCAHCGKGPVQRLLSTPAIQFKGSGWYITDYAQKGKAGGESSGDAAGGKTADGTPGKSADKAADSTSAKGTDTAPAKPAGSTTPAGGTS